MPLLNKIKEKRPFLELWIELMEPTRLVIQPRDRQLLPPVVLRGKGRTLLEPRQNYGLGRGKEGRKEERERGREEGRKEGY
jgi:hypothetical protein